MKRYITYWLNVLVSYGVPITATALIYGVYRSDRSFLNYFTMAGLIATITMIGIFGKDAVAWAKTLGNENGNTAISYAKAPAVIFIICGILLYAHYSIENLMSVLVVSGVANTVSIPLKVAHYNSLPEATKLRLQQKREK